MDYKLGFVLLCLLLTDGASGQSKHTGKCSYFGEPHLLPFPTTPGQTVNQYVCRPGEPEVLVKNKLLTIEVTTSTSGNHPIVEVDHSDNFIISKDFILCDIIVHCNN